MAVDVDLGELLRRILDSRAQDIWTSFPAKVVSYDASTQTADLEPQITRPIPEGDDGDLDFESLSVLPNVPIQFPRGGGDTYAITWKLQAGDYVWVNVCTYAIGNWRRTGEVSDPGDVRSHSLGNCYAVPGAAPNSKTLAQATDVALVIEGPSIKVGKNATDYPGLAAKIMANFNQIKSAISGAATTPGDGGASFKTNIIAALSSFQEVKASKTKVE